MKIVSYCLLAILAGILCMAILCLIQDEINSHSSHEKSSFSTSLYCRK
jgi:hypothetical protein